jgi:myosin heavy subunit
LKFKESEVKDMFKIIAGILLLGNIKFNKSKNIQMMPCGLKEKSKTAVKFVTKNLGIDEKTLIEGITVKQITHKGKTENIYLTKRQCKRKLDGIAVSLYHFLFDWIL